MIQTYRRELTDPCNLSEWVMDTLAVAYDMAGVEVADEHLGSEAGHLMASMAGPPYHPGTRLQEPEFSQDQVFRVYEMTLERAKAIVALSKMPLGRVRLNMQQRAKATSAGS